MDTFRKWLNKPKADDKSLLARFYHADRALAQIASELDSFDGRAEPDRCSRLVSRLRQGQDKVLAITNRIMEELLGEDRAPRAFRAKFPEDVLQENLAGQLWFGAECLAAGSSIMNRELESTSMRPLAQAVTKSLDNVRNLLRDQCLRNNIPNSPTLKLDINDAATEQLYESLKIFDRLFAEFELRYVSAMVQVKSKQEYEMQEYICVLFSETLQRALKIQLLDQEQVDSYDPSLMFSIPRLAIITGLVVYNKGPLNMDMSAEQLSEMFRPFRTILIKIRDLLRTLTKNELYQLEKLLCTNEEIHLKNLNNNSIENTSNDKKDIKVEPPNQGVNLEEIQQQQTIVEVRSSSALSEKLKQEKEKERLQNKQKEDKKQLDNNVENLNSNNCDQNYLKNKQTNDNDSITSSEITSSSINRPEKHNDYTKLQKSNKKLVKTSRRGGSISSKSKNQLNNNNKLMHISKSPSNSISSASSSATTADISSDWSDDEDNDEGVHNHNNRKFSNNQINQQTTTNEFNSDLVTADCASGFLIPNTNFGNLFQQNDDPLTDNIVASEDEYGGGGANEHSGAESPHLFNNVTLTNITADIEALTTGTSTTIQNEFANKSTENIHNNNYERDFPSGSSEEENQINKTSLNSPNKKEQPGCSKMDMTDTSDDSEILRTITQTKIEYLLASKTYTTADSNLDNSKSSCDSISKSSKTSIASTTTTSSSSSNISAGATSSGKKYEKHQHRSSKSHHHHHHHHHHGSSSRSCRHQPRHHDEIKISSSSSSSTNTNYDKNNVENEKTCGTMSRDSRHSHRHHSRKHKSKHSHCTDSSTKNIASSGDTTSSFSDGDAREVDLAVRAAGRMKFKSTENLLHRLFVCIAGVADQLQTNFASDLRQILRAVFLMNTTPVQEEIKIPEKSKDSTDLFEFRPSENDVIQQQENNGGSNQSIYSAEEVNAESDNVFNNDDSGSSGNNSTNDAQINHQQSSNIIERTRSLSDDQEINRRNLRKLHITNDNRRRLSSVGSNHSNESYESPANSSGSNSPIRNNERPINSQQSIVQQQQQQQQTSTPINVVRTSNRRSSTSQIISQTTANRRNLNNNHNNNNSNNNTSYSLPKPSPPAWIPDEDAPRCMACTIPFTAFRRRHHCRNCGGVFCGGCSNSSAPLPKYGLVKAVRVCRDCYVREVGT